MQLHKQITIDGIEFDEGLINILPQLWKRGIKTILSCEGGLTPDNPELLKPLWITFPLAAELEKFLNCLISARITTGAPPERLMPKIWYEWPMRAFPWRDGTFIYDIRIPYSDKQFVEELLADRALELPATESSLV